MARRAVCDHRVRHTVLAQFPRSEFRALISRSRFSYPHMQWEAAVVCGVDRRSRGTVINKCEPTCIAVSKDIDRLVALRFGDLPNERQAVLSDYSAMLRIFICNQIGCAQCQGDLFIHSFSRGDIL